MSGCWVATSFFSPGSLVEIVELRLRNRLDHAAPPAGARWICGAGEDEFPLIDSHAGEEAAGVVKVVVAWTGLRLSEEKVGGVMAVDGAIRRHLSSGQGRESRQQIHGAQQFGAFAIWLNVSRPTGYERNFAPAVQADIFQPFSGAAEPE